MKIAYLILGHTDPNHIARLSHKISEPENVDVYIHIDKKIDIDPYKKQLKHNKSIIFIENRVTVSWGAFSSVVATLNLMRYASKQNTYDRYVLLQGLDYPLMSNENIISFFEENKEVEFIRACNISNAEDRRHRRRYEKYWFYENPNSFKRIINKLNTITPFKMRKKFIYDKNRFDIYWGAAQWALTGECVRYILDFSKEHVKFNQYFKYMFASDESYFHTIVHNSPFGRKTLNKGAEPEKKYVFNWKNLHYFEYPNQIKIFSEEDFDILVNCNYMFFRKATTEKSTKLLDMIDEVTQNKTLSEQTVR